MVPSGVGFSEIIGGSMTPAVWVDTYHKAANQKAKDATKKYTYTGKLK